MIKKKSKLRRVSVLMLILWLPITILFNSLGFFGVYNTDNSILFFIAGFLFFLILIILGPWVEKAFSKEVNE